MKQIQQAITNYWQQRNPRERQILLGGVAILLPILLYSLLLEPLLSERTRLASSLPALRTASLRFSQELAQLKGQTNAPGKNTDLNALAASAGLAGAQIEQQAKSAKLSLNQANWAQLSRFIGDAQAAGWQLNTLQAHEQEGSLNVDVEWTR